MSDDRAFERAIDDWLADGSDRTPRPAVDAVLLAVKTTPQERDLRIPRRTQPMSLPLRIAAGIAIVAVIGVAALTVFRPSTRTGVGAGPSPTASLAPSPTPVPSPSTDPLDPAAWTTYTSGQYGFKIGHPKDWDVDPADRAWDLDTDAADWLSPAMDDFTAPTGDVRVSVWSVPLDPGTIVDETWIEVEAWIEQYCQKTGSPSCSTILDEAVQLCVEVRDCHPGVLVGVAPPFDREVQAFFTGGDYNGQMVVVTVWRAESDPSVARYGGGRRLIEAFLLTMCVSPEDPRGPFPCG